MQVDAFGQSFALIESTSPIVGRLAASLRGDGNVLWADAFTYDPKSKIVTFDQDQLYLFLHDAKKTSSSFAMVFLMITDFAISVIKAIRGLFGGSYGGLFGYGQLGSIIAIVSLMMFIMVAVMAAFVVVPLSIAAWVVRSKIDSGIAAEQVKFLDQILEHFSRLAAAGGNTA